ncbi:unnamed protein product [Trichogramma brassicae]|uniref:Uncharacterized protein n=1 Tax=Trichogramma brassicae TaxID=86971 RepID=A0A6H5I071_9HYME|nr:unnamed protein product [Trichogramma brassicae]
MYRHACSAEILRKFVRERVVQRVAAHALAASSEDWSRWAAVPGLLVREGHEADDRQGVLVDRCFIADLSDRHHPRTPLLTLDGRRVHQGRAETRVCSPTDASVGGTCRQLQLIARKALLVEHTDGVERRLAEARQAIEADRLRKEMEARAAHEQRERERMARETEMKQRQAAEAAAEQQRHRQAQRQATLLDYLAPRVHPKQRVVPENHYWPVKCRPHTVPAVPFFLCVSRYLISGHLCLLSWPHGIFNCVITHHKIQSVGQISYDALYNLYFCTHGYTAQMHYNCDIRSILHIAKPADICGPSAARAAGRRQALQQISSTIMFIST